MNKRLRKKKHIGEFAEWGRQLVITRKTADGLDEFLDVFVLEAIEANGCYCGGHSHDDTLHVVVELGRRSDDPEARFKRITEWLDARSDVRSWKASAELDLWHGPFPDIETEAGKATTDNDAGSGL